LFIFCAILRLHTYETVLRKLVIKTFGSFTAHEQKLIAHRAMVVLDCLGIYGFTQSFQKLASGDKHVFIDESSTMQKD